jgi:hypothetical protein
MSHLGNLSGKVMKKKFIIISKFGDFLTKRSRIMQQKFHFIFRICVKFHKKEMWLVVIAC